MALKLKRVGDLLRGPEKRKPYRDDPLLGALQATILKKMDELGDDASASKVHEELILETGERFDSSLIYGNIRQMADKDHKFLERVGTRPSRDGGSPLRRGLEGIVCKRKDSAYRSGARSSRIKVKAEHWKSANQYRAKAFRKIDARPMSRSTSAHVPTSRRRSPPRNPTLIVPVDPPPRDSTRPFPRWQRDQLL
jgi:hypothetical protein